MQTPFIGRESFLSRLTEHLHDATFVAVTGPPGVGKSRLLACFLSQHTQDRDVFLLDASTWHQDTWLLSLLTHLELIPQDTLEQNINALAQTFTALPNPTLLIDHVEHLHEHLPQPLADLCNKLPTLRILVTTQRMLEHDDVQNLHLPPLQLPDPDEIDAERIFASEAVQMLHAVMGRYQRTPEAQNATKHAQIVHALDGLPLAIEVMATRLDMLSMEQLHTYVTTRGSTQNLSAIESALDWSWRQLPEVEKEALITSTVFHGGFTPQTFEAVLPEQTDAFDALQNLVRHSLYTQTQHQNAFRYHLLSSIRRYVEQKSTQHPSTIETARERHTSYYARLVQDIWHQTQGRYWSAPFKQLEAEEKNLHQAVMYAQRKLEEQGDDAFEQAAWCTLGLAVLHLKACSKKQVRDMLSPVLSWLQDNTPTNATAHGALAIFHLHSLGLRWNAQNGLELLDTYLDTDQNWPEPLLHALQINKATALADHRRPNALSYIQDIRPEIARTQNELFDALLLLALGHALLNQGQLTRAIATFEETADLFQTLKLPRDRARALIFLGFAYQMSENASAAFEALEQATLAFEQAGDIIGKAQALRVLASCSVDSQDVEKAEHSLSALLHLATRHAVQWGFGAAHFHYARLRLEQERYEDALIHCARAAIALERDQKIPLVIAAKNFEVLAHHMLGQHQSADLILDEVLEISSHLRSPMGQVHVLCLASERLARESEFERAKEKLEEAKGVLEGGQHVYASCLIALYQCHIDLPRYNQALARKRKRDAKALLQSISSSLHLLLRPHTDDPTQTIPIQQGAELRIGLKILRKKLPESLERRLAMEMLDLEGQALLIDTEQRAFRPPNADQWEDLSSRETPFRLLSCLLEHHQDARGEPVAFDVLCEAVWPDEVIMAEAASNRLYVTVSQLRRAGLRDVLLSVSGGYLLSPEILIHVNV